MNFNWSSHIKTLDNVPNIKMLWERQFVSIVLDKVPKQAIKKALEVGCSNGRWLRWFKKEYGCEVFGLDNNTEGFNGVDVEFKAGDCRNLPYEDKSFDLVFSLGLVEHFIKKDKEKILKEQARVLKPQGYLICLVPMLGISLNWAYVKLNYDFRKRYKHFRTTQKEIEKIFSKAGVQITYTALIGNIFESLLGLGKFEKLVKNKFMAKLFATEILVIGKKI